MWISNQQSVLFLDTSNKLKKYGNEHIYSSSKNIT